MARMDKCKDCYSKPSYFSLYDAFACVVCDRWLEADHCDGKECDSGFLHTKNVKPSTAQRSSGDF
jgi:hypothetical protein